MLRDPPVANTISRFLIFFGIFGIFGMYRARIYRACFLHVMVNLWVRSYFRPWALRGFISNSLAVTCFAFICAPKLYAARHTASSPDVA